MTLSYRTAVHEAGHIIAAWHTGGDFRTARIFPSGNGVSEIGIPEIPADPAADIVVVGLITMMRCGVALAGEMAASIYEGSEFWPNLVASGGPDLEDITRCTALIGEPFGARVLRACAAKTRATFEHPGIWRATIAIADDLCIAGYLSREDMRALIGLYLDVENPPAVKVDRAKL